MITLLPCHCCYYKIIIRELKNIFTMAIMNFKINRIQCTLCVLFISGYLLLDVYGFTEDNDVPLSKLSQNLGAPTLKVLYCYSCGYRKAFDEYSSIIQQKYPYIIIDGQNYDPPGFNMVLARLIGLLKMVIIACVFGGVNIFRFINRPQASWWIWCTTNKLYACLMIFFLSNIIEGQLVQSGAFEMLLNDVPVWSKLETGRIPQPAELFQIIDNHMRFDNSIEVNGGLGFDK